MTTDEEPAKQLAESIAESYKKSLVMIAASVLFEKEEKQDED